MKAIRPSLTRQNHVVSGLCFSWGMCSILPPLPCSSGASAWSYLATVLTLALTAWRWHPVSTGSASHLHVFGLCSWEPRLASDQLALTSRSWAGKGFGPTISEPEFRVTWPFTLSARVAEEQVVKVLWLEICWCNRFFLLEYTYVWFTLHPVEWPFSILSQKHPSRNPNIKKESCSALNLKQDLEFYNQTIVLKSGLCWEEKRNLSITKASFKHQE